MDDTKQSQNLMQPAPALGDDLVLRETRNQIAVSEIAKTEMPDVATM
jgi:hypothetical protein